VLQVWQQPVSLDAPIPGMDGTVVENTIADEKAPEPMKESVRRFARDALEEALAHLDVTQRRVLALRFGLSDQGAKSVEEVARLTGMTRERVRQVEKQALRRLRAVSRELNIEEALRPPADGAGDE
jgi:RNA polymerase primary sigma factor